MCWRNLIPNWSEYPQGVHESLTLLVSPPVIACLFPFISFFHAHLCAFYIWHIQPLNICQDPTCSSFQSLLDSLLLWWLQMWILSLMLFLSLLYIWGEDNQRFPGQIVFTYVSYIKLGTLFMLHKSYIINSKQWHINECVLSSLLCIWEVTSHFSFPLPNVGLGARDWYCFPSPLEAGLYEATTPSFSYGQYES